MHPGDQANPRTHSNAQPAAMTDRQLADRIARLSADIFALYPDAEAAAEVRARLGVLVDRHSAQVVAALRRGKGGRRGRG